MKVWVTRSLTRFEDFTPTIPMSMLGGMRGPEGCIGCMFVFSSYEAALAWVDGDSERIYEAELPKGA